MGTGTGVVVTVGEAIGIAVTLVGALVGTGIGTPETVGDPIGGLLDVGAGTGVVVVPTWL